MPKRKRSYEYCRNRYGIFKQRRVRNVCNDYRSTSLSLRKKIMDTASPRDSSGNTSANKCEQIVAPFQNKYPSLHNEQSLAVLTSLLRLSEDNREHSLHNCDSSGASGSSTSTSTTIFEWPSQKLAEMKIFTPHVDTNSDLTQGSIPDIDHSNVELEDESMVDVSRHYVRPNTSSSNTSSHLASANCLICLAPRPRNNDSTNDDSDEGFCDEPVTKRSYQFFMQSYCSAEPDEGVMLVEEASNEGWTRRKQFKQTKQ